MKQNRCSQIGASMVETIAVIAVIAIVLIASIFGYDVLVHYWHREQTVRLVAEVMTRYRTRTNRTTGPVEMRSVYPEGDRIDAYTVRTADNGAVHIEVGDVSSFAVVVNSVLADTCEAILTSGTYDAVLFKEGTEAYDPQGGEKEYCAIGRELLKNWDNVDHTVPDGVCDDVKDQIKSFTTRKELLDHLCASPKTRGNGADIPEVDADRVMATAFVLHGGCAERNFSNWHGYVCNQCSGGRIKDQHGTCCKPSERTCGDVCVCPPWAPHCNTDVPEGETPTCVECRDDSDCSGAKPVCDPSEHKCVPCIVNTLNSGICSGKNKWCHKEGDGYYCDECLTDYDEVDNPAGECCYGEDTCTKAICDKSKGLENWYCKGCPCDQELSGDSCVCKGLSNGDGVIGLNEECTATPIEGVASCSCATGLKCTPGESAEQCASCQCISDENEGLPADAVKAKGRQYGADCWCPTQDGICDSTDGCPCGTNENGVQLVCGDGNKCYCTDDGEYCSNDGECCTGVCTEGICGSCTLGEGVACDQDNLVAPNCCTLGLSCSPISGKRQTCCKGKGNKDDECSSNNCCAAGLECKIEEGKTVGKCVPPPTCSVTEGQECNPDATSDNHPDQCCKALTAEGNSLSCQNISDDEDKKNYLCCYGDGSLKSYCTADVCCKTGKCEGYKCVADCSDHKCTRKEDGSNNCCPDTDGEAQNCVIQSGTEGTCCPSEQEGNNGDKCGSSDCCTSGRCVETTETDGEGHKIDRCCPAGNGGVESACTADYCCNDGLVCEKEGDEEIGKCVPPPTCSVTEGLECAPGATASDHPDQCCVSASEGDSTQLTCLDMNPEEDETAYRCCYNDGSPGASCTITACCQTGLACNEGHCCPAEAKYWWKQTTESAGHCCPDEGGTEINNPCTTSNCCQSGNCVSVTSEGVTVTDPLTPLCCPEGVNMLSADGTKCYEETCPTTEDKRKEVNAACYLPEDMEDCDCVAPLVCKVPEGTESRLGSCQCPTTDAQRSGVGAECYVGLCPCITPEGGAELTCVPDNPGTAGLTPEVGTKGTCQPVCPPSGPGATCDAYCPCEGTYTDGDPLTCTSQNICCTKTKPYWVKETVDGTENGRCCAQNKIIPEGGSCSAGDCCAGGNECDPQVGICCSPDSTDPKCCRAKGQNWRMRQVYMKKVEQTRTNYPCIQQKWKTCKSTHCGKPYSYACYECLKYDTTQPQVTATGWKIEGMAGPEFCCEGDGELGSPCSEECPCVGTKSMYYRNGNLVDTDRVESTQNANCSYDDCSCVTTCRSVLYCKYTRDANGNRVGRCEETAKTMDDVVKDYSARKVNCAYDHDFEGEGACWICPANTSFRFDENNVGCCDPRALTINAYDINTGARLCSLYSIPRYQAAHEADEVLEGFYYEGDFLTLCPSGYYCQGGHKYPCEAGTYSDMQGATSCQPCGKGYYCPEGASQRTVCPDGHYCPTNYTGSPIPCPAGTTTDSYDYNTRYVYDEKRCLPCPKGYYCPGNGKKISCTSGNSGIGADLFDKGCCNATGLTAPEVGSREEGKAQYCESGKLQLCPKGYYCDGGKQYRCKAGTYSDTLGAASCKDAPVGIYIHNDGSYGNTQYASSYGWWAVCPVGFYCPGGAVWPLKCPKNTYQDQERQGECKPCPAGTFTDGEGSTSINACKGCAQLAHISDTETMCCDQTGQVVVTNERTGHEICCPPGQHYCWNRTQYTCTNSCVTLKQCEPGQYSANGSCFACDAGYHCPDGVMEIKCPAGSYSSGKGNKECTLCPKGTYANTEGSRQCKDAGTCGNGSYTTCAYVANKEIGATGTIACGKNKTPNADHTECVSCPTGMYRDSFYYWDDACKGVCKEGERYVGGTCQKCRKDYYCPNGAQEFPCPTGKYSMPGSTSCTACSGGTYWDHNEGVCKECPAGSYCVNGVKKECTSGLSGAGASKCLTCSPGQYFNSQTNSCESCASGSYSDEENATSCKSCPKGTYSKAGASACTPCPEGSYQGSTGRSSCINCANGKWYEGTGATGSGQCTACPEGFYCANGKKTECPAGNYCKAGSGAYSPCPVGTYQDQTKQTSSDACKSCPTGTIASSRGSTSCVACGENQYSSNGTNCSNCYGTIVTTVDGRQTCCSSGTRYCEHKNYRSGAYGCYQPSMCKE